MACEARDALAWNPLVPASVYVTVQDCWVILSGDVKWQYQRTAAERVVRRIRGIAGITNLVRVSSQTADAAVKREICRALENEMKAAGRITVEVDGRTAILRGIVSSEGARRTAEAGARRTPGIAAVHNKLVIAAGRPDAWRIF